MAGFYKMTSTGHPYNFAMRSRYLPTLFIVFLCLGLAGSAPDADAPGVVFEEVGKGSALEKAGLLPGDLAAFQIFGVWK